jgi:hypothetical protein
MELSELSSIISLNVREEARKDMDLDSIKNEIDKISNCLPSREDIRNEEVERLEIKNMNEQHELNANGFVQISERALDNHCEYFVRYNLSDKLKTNVMRVSPLRFRRKEEVVKHLVSANIVSKESNSINIP